MVRGDVGIEERDVGRHRERLSLAAGYRRIGSRRPSLPTYLPKLAHRPSCRWIGRFRDYTLARHMSAFEDLLTGWDGEQVAVRYDAEFATWMFIGVHSTRAGRSGGGTRMAVYERPEDALADALRLSAAMTRKMAVCDV